MAKLTDKQKRFVDEYLKDLNATQAAIRSGYSQKSAARIAIELLNKTHVQAEIQRRQSKREKRTKVTQDMVVKELARVAFANGSEFAKVTEQPVFDALGVPLVDKDGKQLTRQCVVLTPTEQLTSDQRAAIAGIKEGKNGIEVATCDKVKALELLGRHLGMFTDNVKLSGTTPVQIINDIPKGDNSG
ncbi:Terminase small subunit [anaerobic digester metagenome]